MSALAAVRRWAVAAWRRASAPVEQTDDELRSDEQHWQVAP